MSEEKKSVDALICIKNKTEYNHCRQEVHNSNTSMKIKYNRKQEIVLQPTKSKNTIRIWNESGFPISMS